MKTLKLFLTVLGAIVAILVFPHAAKTAFTFQKAWSGSPDGKQTNHQTLAGPAATENARSADQTSVNGSPNPESHPSPQTGSASPNEAQEKRAMVFGERGTVTIDHIPPGRFREQLLALPEAPRRAALARLEAERVPLFDVRSLHVDAEGMLFYACPAAPDSTQAVTAEMLAPSQAPVPISSPPARSSKPGSTKIIYLDFNGHTVTGTAWNSSNPSYQCLPYDLDGDPTTFSDYEQSQIIEVWERVAEDFKAFDINVTTSEPASFGSTVARALITKNTDATGANNPSSTAGGVAYKNVFGTPSFHTGYSPAFAYFNKVGNTAPNIAEVVSHEVGHNLGLSHDGTTSTEYYSGHGSGENSWGAIMGAAYGKNFTQWSKGDYYRANNTEDDLAIISAKTGFAADDAAATLGNANSLVVSDGGFLGDGFFIGANADVDLHRIVIDQASVTINAESFKVPASASFGSNLGIQLELLSSAGNLVAAAASQGQSTATISTSVATGTYYIRVAGTSNGSPLASTPTGFTSYGSMGSYKIYGSVGSGGGNFSPVVATGDATSATLNATTLGATVNPRGLSTGVFFQYGTSETFGQNSATQSAGSGSSNTTVSASLSGLVPATTYYYRAVAQNSAGVSYGATRSFLTISNSTALQSLILSTGSLSPTFSTATRNYTVSVPFETTSLTANWTTVHPSAVAQVRVNTGAFTTAPGGTHSGNFALALGNTTVTIQVRAQDGATTANHTLKISRARSADTALSSLQLGAGAFSPSFSPSTSNYTLAVANAAATTTVTATKPSAGGKIEARVGAGRFAALNSGVASSALALASGANTLEVRVTADNGTTSASYFFSIHRTASSTSLTNLLTLWNKFHLTPAPAFSSNATDYSLTVANSISAITVLPTLAEKYSSITARVGGGNFTAIAAGKASSALALSPGPNTVQVRVLSDDKVTTRTYSLAVSRLAAPLANPAENVTLNGTTLRGTIDARSTAAAFQIGTTSLFGSTLPVSYVGGNGTTPVSSSTGALQASTLYYFRLTGQYGGITDNGTTGTFLSPARVSLSPTFFKGGNATGIVPAATFEGFGTPAINLHSDTAFNATVKFLGSSAANNAGIWTVVNGTTRLAARLGSNATGGGVFSALGEPVLDDNGRCAFIGSLKVGVGGVTKTSATGIWQVSANGTASLLARAGNAAPGAAGTVFSSFTSLVTGESGVAFTAKLTSGSANVTSSNNTGLWAQNGSGNLVLVARTGASPTPTLSSLSLFNAVAGQNGHSRHFNNSGDLLILAKFGTSPLGIYKAIFPSFTLNGPSPVAAISSSAPGIPGGTFSAISNPILNGEGEVAFSGTFTGNGVASGNNTAIFRYSKGGAGTLLVRTGALGSDGRAFQSLSAPILNDAGHIVFTGALKTGVGGVTSANATGIWTVSSNNTLATIVRAGDAAHGLNGALFASFNQIAFPEENWNAQTAGVAFIATLATGPGGITKLNNIGLWISSTPGTAPSLVVRIGDSFSVGGVARTVSSFALFSASPTTTGARRSFNSIGELVFKLTFTDGSSGIFKYRF